MRFSFVSLVALVISAPFGFKVSFEIELSVSSGTLSTLTPPTKAGWGDTPKIQLYASTIV